MSCKCFLFQFFFVITKTGLKGQKEHPKNMKKWPFERAGGLTVFCVVGTFLYFILNDPLYRSLL